MTETPTETFITFLRPKHPFITIKSEMPEALTHEIIGRQFTLPHIVSGNIGNILKTTLIVLCQRHYAMTRSEEHTSELQSRQYLVCRLLLEKKKQQVSSLALILSDA